MTVRYFIKLDNTFAGYGVDGGIPEGAVQEVGSAPPDGRMVWDGDAWAFPLQVSKDLAAEAIQAMLDGAAKARRYDSGTSLASYATSTIPAWAAEADAFIAWRDAVWAYAYEQFDLVGSGQRPPPASIEALLAELPTPSWP